MKSITPNDASKYCVEICGRAPVIPVIIYNEVETAFDLGSALVNGGLPILEVTLRTPNALAVISEMQKISGAVVGAGTLMNKKDVINALEAGAQFGVSPGATNQVIHACEEYGLPLLAGAATATEAMNLFDRGYTVQKFFPAEASGGANALKALSSPLEQIRFCPTGGVTLENAKSYLDLPNVLCVGGSWVASNQAVDDANWGQAEEIVQHTYERLSIS